MKPTITVHTLVKNEENFVGYAIKSVIDFVDQIIVFDTGSTDKTVQIIENLAKDYPNKIIFEEKGICDKKRHTELRQEMINRTRSDWFMILDGDEVWTKRGMEEIFETIEKNPNAECLIAPFYLCVGDVYHRYYRQDSFNMLGKTGQFSPRIIKRVKNVHWQGDYNSDVLIFADGEPVFREENTIFLKNNYWHMTHLKRSSTDDTDYSSYGSRKEKRRETYFVIGRKIKEKIPEVFGNKLKKLFYIKSFCNLIILIHKKFFYGNR